jgi:hypothetical protein
MNVQPGTSRERQAIPIHLPSQGKVRGSQSRLAKREAKVARGDLPNQTAQAFERRLDQSLAKTVTWPFECHIACKLFRETVPPRR